METCPKKKKDPNVSCNGHWKKAKTWSPTSPLSSYAWLLGRGRENQMNETSKGSTSAKLISKRLSSSTSTTRLSTLRHNANSNSSTTEEMLQATPSTIPLLPRRTSTQSLPAVLGAYERRQGDEDNETHCNRFRKITISVQAGNCWTKNRCGYAN